MTSASPARADSRADLPRLGLRNFWYPAAKSSQVGRKPLAVKLLGEEIMLLRESGELHALHNRCPHRGIPLTAGKRHFPGTISCMYHGWTFNMQGECVEALNEGPDSQLPGKVRVRSYPVQEINGIAWIYMGDGAPSPIAEQVPAEVLDTRNIVHCQTEVWNCSWMPAVENLMDSHDVFVHRSSIFFLFRKLPCWMNVAATELPDGKGVDFKYSKMGPVQDTYKRVGRWPRHGWWRQTKINSPKPGEYPTTELRLPCVVRVGFATLMFVRYMVPVDENHVRAFLLTSRHAPGLSGITYRLYYHLWASWSLLKYFIGQDRVVFETQDYWAPERLASTDVGLVKWRRLVATVAKKEAADRQTVQAGTNRVTEQAEALADL